MQNIISVHMPKAAGTSFLHQLKTLYGEHQVLLDYNDDPTNPLSVISIDPYTYDVNPIRTISPHKIVHGHFHPRKYAYIKDAFRLTFLRHPIDNVMSIYDFWAAHNKDFWNHPVFKYFKEANLSLPRLAMIPQLRYLYSRSYFGDFDMSTFDFIGDYTQYDSELIRLGNCLEVTFDNNVHYNKTYTTSNAPEITNSRRSRLSDDECVELELILRDDIAFYEFFKGR
jgi:hypothetical protein